MDAYGILQDGDARLRAVSAPVPAALFGTPELNQTIEGLASALDGEPDGVAIAAPQAGIPWRLFLVRHDRVLPTPPEGEPELPADVGVFINPEFVRTSKKKSDMEEGCLSVRGFYGKVKRHERATVRAQRADGTVFERGGGGLLAQIFQHEIDHLNGILFIDHATALRKSRKAEAGQAAEGPHAHGDDF